MAFLIFYLVSTLLTAQVFAQVDGLDSASCFFPDKSLDTGSVPCNPDAVNTGGHSTCCAPHDICFEGGVCYQGWSDVMYRQGCTDPTFKDPSCPQVCLDSDLLDIGVWVQTCDVQNNQACCVTTDKTCCDDKTTYFDFVPGNIVGVLGENNENLLAVAASSSNPTMITSIMTLTVTPTATAYHDNNGPSTSTTTTALATDPVVFLGESETTTDGDEESLPNTTSSSSSSLPSPSPFNKKAAIAGLTVLGGLLALTLACCGFMYTKYVIPATQSSSRHRRQGSLPPHQHHHYSHSPSSSFSSNRSFVPRHHSPGGGRGGSISSVKKNLPMGYTVEVEAGSGGAGGGGGGGGEMREGLWWSPSSSWPFPRATGTGTGGPVEVVEVSSEVEQQQGQKHELPLDNHAYFVELEGPGRVW